MPKGFNWEAGPHCTWTLWRPPVGPGPRHWHWYCPTQSYLHFESCHLMTWSESSLQVEPSWRWEIPGQVQVTRFRRVHCRTQTGQLSSRGLFLSRAAVRRHISHWHAQACRSAGLGHRDVPIQVPGCAVDVMAGGGGGAGLAPVERVWRATELIYTPTFYLRNTRNSYAVYSQRSGRVYEKYAQDHGFESCLHFFWIQEFLACTSTYQYKPVHTGMYLSVLICTGMY